VRIAPALLVAALASACGPGPTGPPPVGAVDMTQAVVLTVQLGTIADPAQADSAFVALVDGQDATLVEGAQGGFHVWLKLRVAGGPRALTLAKTAYRVSDNALVLRTTGALLQVGAPGPGGTWELPTATPMFMCPSPIGIKVIDTPISYEITLSDGAATVAHGQVTLTPHCPAAPADTAAFCNRICVG